MNRHIARTVILAKKESTPGVDATPTGASDAVLIASNMSISNFEAAYVDRALVRGYMGGSEQLVGPVSKKVSFDVELAGSGAADTPPEWGDLLAGCGWAQAVLTTPDRVEYTPVSSGFETLTIYYYDDGVVHKLLGAMGNVKLSAKVGEIPKLMFEFIGVDGGDTATTNATPTYSAWQPPVVVAKANAVDITLGCSYSAGALSGGTVHRSTGLELDLGNQTAFNAFVSAEDVDISNRNASGSAQFDLTAAQEVAKLATVRAGTTQGLGYTIGTTTGNKIIIFAPAVQLTAPSKAEQNGGRMIGYSLGFKPVSGNDELRLVSV